VIRSIGVSFAFVLALLVLAPALSPALNRKDEREAAGAEHTVVGEVVSVDAAARTFAVKETLKGGARKQVAFELAPDAKVMIHGKASSLDEVRAGDSVTVRFIEKEGKKIARSCDVAKPAAKTS
jgi:hypothetical protein